MIDEVAKYHGIYSNQDAYPKYGHSNHGARAVRIVEKWKPKRLLDVGCGWNEFAQMVRAKVPGCEAVGVDAACPGADLQVEAHQLPFGAQSFDVVTAFDVLEHLPECEVDAALREMARVASNFIFSISYVASVTRWQGQTLHPTVRSEEWWIERIMRAGGVSIAKSGRFITGQWQPYVWPVNTTDTVVLVGNGPSALRADWGPIIDAHRHVVRFNDFKTRGFEAQVGTRTSLWSSVGGGRIVPDSPTESMLLIDGETLAAPQVSWPVERLPRWFYNQVRRELQERSRWRHGFAEGSDKLLATSGLLVLCWLLRIKGVERVTLVGFDHFSKARSSQHHYWIPSAFKAPKEHDGEAEAAMVADLVVAGRVTYL